MLPLAFCQPALGPVNIGAQLKRHALLRASGTERTWHAWSFPAQDPFTWSRPIQPALVVSRYVKTSAADDRHEFCYWRCWIYGVRLALSGLRRPSKVAGQLPMGCHDLQQMLQLVTG